MAPRLGLLGERADLSVVPAADHVAVGEGGEIGGRRNRAVAQDRYRPVLANGLGGGCRKSVERAVPRGTAGERRADPDQRHRLLDRVLKPRDRPPRVGSAAVEGAAPVDGGRRTLLVLGRGDGGTRYQQDPGDHRQQRQESVNRSHKHALGLPSQKVHTPIDTIAVPIVSPGALENRLCSAIRPCHGTKSASHVTVMVS